MDGSEASCAHNIAGAYVQWNFMVTLDLMMVNWRRLSCPELLSRSGQGCGVPQTLLYTSRPDHTSLLGQVRKGSSYCMHFPSLDTRGGGDNGKQ